MHQRKIYKKTATGATQVWFQERVNDRYRTHSGQDGGVITTSEWTVAKPKNVGRSNETSGPDQAALEVEANYKLKLKSGYSETIDDAAASIRFSPMLAKVYGDYTGDIDMQIGSRAKPVYVQPKLDGIRCIATKTGLWSRQGNPIIAVPHIIEALKSIFEKEPGLILDGELYAHSLKDDFPALVSLIKKQKPSAKDVIESRVIEYWVYDAPSEFDTGDRMAHVRNVVDSVGVPLMVVPTIWAKSQMILDEAHEMWLGEGFEGSMVRLTGPYEQKRSKLLLKRKEWMEEEFVLLDIIEGEGNRSGMAGNAVVRLPNGGEGSANVMGDRAFLREVLADRNRLIGKEVTVKFFGYTPDGSLRFPRTKLFHKEKRW